MKKRFVKYDGVIQKVILHGNDAEIHMITTDGMQLTVHHHHPTEADIAVLRNQVGKEFHVEVEAPAETTP